MLRTGITLFLVPLALLLAPSRADACSCIGGLPICQTFWQTDAVFAGTVLSIEPIPNPSGERFMAHQRIRFQVQEAWRGGVEGIVEIRTGAGGGDCGYRFEQGEAYLVYAHARGGGLSTSICSRTRKLAQASEDLAYLKTAMRPSATGRIYGVVRYQQDSRTRGPDRYIAGYTVQLSDGTRSRTGTTDADGRFEFTGIAAGKYTISLATPDTEHAYGPRDVTLADPRGCAAANFHVVPDGRLSLRLVDGTGEPRSKVLVELLDLGARSADRPLFPRAVRETDADGRVEFAQLHPNQYAVSVNGTRPPGIDMPYAARYFPDADSLDAARTIDLGLGERLDLGDWVLPAPLPSRRVTGQVAWPDGTPAAGAHVLLLGGRGGPWQNRTVDKGSVTTDREGRFTLTVHEGITYEVRAYLNTGEPVVQWTTPRVEFSAGPSTTPVRLVLQPAPGRRVPK